MPRLIDAEKLAEYKASGVSDLTEWQKGWNDAIDTIMGETPTVDAEPVVRCKDCKFWHTEGQYCDRFGVMWEEFYTSPNDYCSWAERREDADN